MDESYVREYNKLLHNNYIGHTKYLFNHILLFLLQDSALTGVQSIHITTKVGKQKKNNGGLGEKKVGI